MSRTSRHKQPRKKKKDKRSTNTTLGAPYFIQGFALVAATGHMDPPDFAICPLGAVVQVEHLRRLPRGLLPTFAGPFGSLGRGSCYNIIMEVRLKNHICYRVWGPVSTTTPSRAKCTKGTSIRIGASAREPRRTHKNWWELLELVGWLRQNADATDKNPVESPCLRRHSCCTSSRES